VSAHARRSQGEHRLIAALLAGDTVEAAARAAGLSTATAHRRLASADFQRALGAARTRTLQRSLAILAEGTVAAAAQLRTLTTDASLEQVRLAAATRVLELSLRGTEVVDLVARVAALEQQAASTPTPNGHSPTYRPV